ncbi:hypothetical protein [Enhygromyxa salina]|uniref:Uncharacterized protein n=1 Tax=Enhygromyxa salina TaxID=215803 RepID=A0A2S9YLY7_9BACT|nr:hypothetical protein [Enhygromyxa salina]PRQ06117.1 hypothetical protein ENSA7_41510 [Enhygromyxa salina]
MPRPLNIVLAAVAGLGAIAVGSYLAWPSDPVSRVTIDDPAQHWEREGFVEMVPPIQLPSSTAAATDVAVWLRIPERGVIHTRWSEARGGWVLEFPPGTVADRVEQRGADRARGVVDVRGTRLGDDHEEWMHTLRRAEPGPNAPLFGYEWPRSDPAAHQRATDELLGELAAIPPAAKMTPERRERYLASIRRKNDCASCHAHERPDNAVEGEHGLVNRGTDASGFFTPQTVLMDAVVLEGYGGVDPNLEDPAITLICPDGSQPTLKQGKRVRAVCPDRGVPVARLDYTRIDEQRLTKLCRARRYLLDHLDEQGRRVFASALDPCQKPDSS